jgi:hypothetical protein
MPDARSLASDIRHLSSDGGVAQLGERLLCKQEVDGSIPFTSTSPPAVARHGRRQAKELSALRAKANPP